MNMLIEYEKSQNKNSATFKVGDIICVNFNIIEKGYKGRTQNFEGLVISIKKKSFNATCTIRKISFGEGVEKTFFINSPTINFIKIKKSNIVRKAKLYYTRQSKNKLFKLKEKINRRRGVRAV